MSNHSHNNQIAVLDFGGQYAHLIANRIRRLGVKSIIKPANSTTSDLKNFAGIILSGGPKSVNEPNAPLPAPGIFNLQIPILGICYGHQAMAKVLGGTIQKGKTKEYGFTELIIGNPLGIFKGFSKKSYPVWSSHWDEVIVQPPHFETIGHSKDSPHIAIADTKRNFYGIQFHAEVTHTPIGKRIFQNFIKLTRAKKTWDMKRFQKMIEEYIKETVKKSKRKVFMLVSGGVDSMVAFTLLNKVLGPDNVYGLLVDTGFMRKNEIEEIKKALGELNFYNLHAYPAKDEYFKALQNIVDPEEKRKIIGDKFIEIQTRAIKELGLGSDSWLLGQGTIYPDTIESGGTEHADKIKTHHNRVPEIQNLINQGLVIEPLADLYKDEVRELGEQLGLPPHLVWRHPFPGPGLAIRCLCSESIKDKLPPERTGEELVDNFIRSKYKDLSLGGYIAPIQTVGVQGDARTYRHPVIILQSWEQMEWQQESLQITSTELTNRFDMINRVLINLLPYHKPLLTTKFTILPNLTLTENRIDLLQQADKIVMDEIESFDLEEKMIWQCPTILIPLSTDGKNESIVLRPVSSTEAMTANFALIPEKNLKNIIRKLKQLPISGIFYDITNKPPGTIEWE